MTDSSKAFVRFVIATLLLGGCASTGALPPPNPTPVEYRIGPEDVIEVVVWNSDNVNRTVPVRPDGMISLPLVNDVQAAGQTALELRNNLIRAFRKFIPDAEVFVIVQEINSPKVLVVGEVVHPGRYVIKGPTTVLDVVAQAGGLTEFASDSDATLTRTLAGKLERYEVTARVDEASAGRNTVPVQPGDIIVVP